MQLTNHNTASPKNEPILLLKIEMILLRPTENNLSNFYGT